MWLISNLPYNGILGRPALAKFMAASHYAYNTLKMPRPLGVIIIPSDEKDAIICVDKMYQEAVTTDVVEATTPDKESKKKKGSFFWSCSGYPACTGLCFDKGGKPDFSTFKTK